MQRAAAAAQAPLHATAKLAREIGREEKRMADFLATMIDQLALDVVHDEVPVSEIRAPAAARRTSAPAASPRSTTRAKATTTRAKAKPAARAKAKPATRTKAAARPKAASGAKRS